MNKNMFIKREVYLKINEYKKSINSKKIVK